MHMDGHPNFEKHMMKMNDILKQIEIKEGIEILGKSGSVFYTGYGTLLNPNGVYLLGINPGGNPEEITESVAKNLHDFQYRNPYFNAYLDEDWGDNDFQAGVKDACAKLGLSLREICGGNFIFERTRSEKDIRNKGTKINAYTYFHDYVINNIINPSAIIVFGSTLYDELKEKDKIWIDEKIESKPLNPQCNNGSPRYCESSDGDKILCYIPHPSRNGYQNFSDCAPAIEEMRKKIHEKLNKRDISHLPKWNFINSWQSLFLN